MKNGLYILYLFGTVLIFSLILLQSAIADEYVTYYGVKWAAKNAFKCKISGASPEEVSKMIYESSSTCEEVGSVDISGSNDELICITHISLFRFSILGINLKIVKFL